MSGDSGGIGSLGISQGTENRNVLCSLIGRPSLSDTWPGRCYVQPRCFA